MAAAAAAVVYVPLGSGTRLRLLSNFSDAPYELTWPTTNDLIPAHLAGVTAVYPSSEHAYQALRSLNRATAHQFERGGCLSDWSVYAAWPVLTSSSSASFKRVDMAEAKRKFWGEARGCIGIIAKMAVGLPPRVAKEALGLDLIPPASDRRLTLEQDLSVWLPILTAKYRANPPHRRALLGTGTGTVLVESGRFRKPEQYWTAYIDKEANTLIGLNRMGSLMRIVRALLAHEEAAAENE